MNMEVLHKCNVAGKREMLKIGNSGRGMDADNESGFVAVIVVVF